MAHVEPHLRRTGTVGAVVARGAGLTLVAVVAMLGALPRHAGAQSRQPPPVDLPHQDDPAIDAPTAPCTTRVAIAPTLLGADLRLRFVLVNNERTPQTVTLRGGCAGFVSLTGLPEAIFPGRVTACRDDQPVRTITVRPRQRVRIGQFTVRGTPGRGRPVLPTGSLLLQASVSADRHVCSSPTLHLVRSPRGTLRRARPGEQAVPPTPATAPRCTPCAIGCPDGVPLTGTGLDGCPVCGCTGLLPAPACRPGCDPTGQPGPDGLPRCAC